jgi:glutaminyl-tRNA synthetase
VEERKVRDWDDPRLATIVGLRRRGYPPEAINAFCRDIGVTRNENVIEMARLEHFVRECLDAKAKRAFVVLRPLRVTLVNVPEDVVHTFEAPDFPKNKAGPSHTIHLNRTVWIEREDYRDVDSADFFGLAPGKLAGLQYAGYVKVVEAVRDAAGEVVELRAEYTHDRATMPTVKVKGNLHWVSGSAPGALPARAEVRLYQPLFTTLEPGETGDWEAELNLRSEEVLTDALVDASLAAPGLAVWQNFQFVRLGYFVVDRDSDPAAGRYVFNQTVSLKGK